VSDKQLLRTTGMKKIGIFGAGKLGCALGKYFKLKHLEIAGIYGRNPKVGQQVTELVGANFFDQLEDLVLKSDILFLTVVDQAIEDLWFEMVKFDLAGKIIIHCSGAKSSRVFEGVAALGAFGYSLHPVMTLSAAPDAYLALENAHFTLEGDSGKLTVVKDLITSLGNQVHVVDSDQKALYHCAAVFASNFMIAVAQKSMQLLARCGMDEAGQAILFPLMETSIKNVANAGAVKALTGPVERGDLETVEKHLAVLNADEKRLYASLSRILIEVATEKNPETDYSELKEVVKETL